jgi:hypothetical protein
MWLTRVGILVTLGAFTAFGVEYLRVATVHRDPGELAEAAVFLFVVAFLVYGGLVYLTSRLGWLRSKLEFRHVGADELRSFCSEASRPPSRFWFRRTRRRRRSCAIRFSRQRSRTIRGGGGPPDR